MKPRTVYPEATGIEFLSLEPVAGVIEPGKPDDPVVIGGVKTSIFHRQVNAMPRAYATPDGRIFLWDLSSVYRWEAGQLRAVGIADTQSDASYLTPVPGRGHLLAIAETYRQQPRFTLADLPAGATAPRVLFEGARDVIGLHRGAPLVVDWQGGLHRVLGEGRTQTLAARLPSGLTPSSADAVRGDLLLLYGEHGAYRQRDTGVDDGWGTHLFTLDLVTGELVHRAEIEGGHELSSRSDVPRRYLSVEWADHDRRVGVGLVGPTTVVDVASAVPVQARRP